MSLQKPSFQEKVEMWLLTCFGEKPTDDARHRTFRFLEEALELAQSLNCSREEAIQLVEYVYSRPIGEPFQEAGGTMVSLVAVCSAYSIRLEDAARIELDKVYREIGRIRHKRANRPASGSLPL